MTMAIGCSDPAGAIKALQEYDFMSPAARQKFQDLLDMLQQQLGVTIEVLDMAMRPIAPGAAGDVRSALEEPRILIVGP